MPHFIKKRKSTPKKTKRRLQPLADNVRRVYKFKGQAPNRQMQQLIVNAHRFFRREKLQGAPFIDVKKALERTAACLGIGVNLVTKYKMVATANEQFATPGKSRKRVRPVTGIDSFDKDAIKYLIYELHREAKHFTLKDLLYWIKKRDIGFTGGRESLRKVIHDIGFFFSKKDGIVFLKETPRIAMDRYRFLIKFRQVLLQDLFHFKWGDETWTFEFGTGKTRIWTDRKKASCPSKKPEGGARYIIVHYGGAEGWIDGAAIVFRSGKVPIPGDDYHGDMNGELFLDHIEVVFQRTEDPSAFVVDNAPYHKLQVEEEKRPTKASGKPRIIAWLAKHRVFVSLASTVEYLMRLVKGVRAPIIYRLEQLAHKYGHIIIWLPPYHPEYNPIELIWGLIKRYFDAHCTEKVPRVFPQGMSRQECSRLRSEAVKSLIHEAIETITPEMWNNSVQKILKRIDEDHEEQVGHFLKTGEFFQMVIPLGQDDEDDSDEETVDDPDAVNDVEMDLAAPLPPSPTYSFGVDVPESDIPPPVSAGAVALEPVSREIFCNGKVAAPTKIEKHGRTVTKAELHEAVSALLQLDSKPPPCYYMNFLECRGPLWQCIKSRHISNDEVLQAVASLLPPLVKPQLQLKEPAQEVVSDSVVEVEEVAEYPTIHLLSSDEEEVAEARVEGLGVNVAHIGLKDFERGCNLPLEEIIVIRNGIGLRVESVLRILGEHANGWLDDDGILFYLKLMAEKLQGRLKVHVFDTNWYTKVAGRNFEAVERWTKKVDLFQCDVVLVPIHLGNHWAQVIIEPHCSALTYYDSMGSGNQRALDDILLYLQWEYEKKRKQRFPRSLWKHKNAQDIPLQRNSSDCGAILCFYSTRICEGASLTKATVVPAALRKILAKQVLDVSLTDDLLLEPPPASRPKPCREYDIPLSWRQPWGVGGGIVNTGNTCYIASIVQLLIHCAPFMEWFWKADNFASMGAENVVTSALQEVFTSCMTENVTSPDPILRVLERIHSNFVVGHQADAHEFLLKLREQLTSEHRAMHNMCPEEETPIQYIFGSYTRNTVRCTRCNWTSTTWLYNEDIPLDIHGRVTISQALAGFFGSESLTDFKCCKCHRYTTFEKTVTLEVPPKVLCLQLKRFLHNGKKNTTFVRFPPILNMTNFLTPSIGNSPVKYNLRGAVTHRGSTAGCGHYWATCHTSTNAVFKFDDSQVINSSLQKLLNENVCLLFYVQS